MPQPVPQRGFVRDCPRTLAGLGRELHCIVEQDLYPCDWERPLPIATHAHAYFKACGMRVAASRPYGAATWSAQWWAGE